MLPSLHLRTLYPDPSPGTLPGQDGSKGHWMRGTACRTWLQHPSLGGTPASACPELRHVPTPQVWSEKQPGREIDGSGHTCQWSAACRSRSGTRAPGRQETGEYSLQGHGTATREGAAQDAQGMPRGCRGSTALHVGQDLPAAGLHIAAPPPHWQAQTEGTVSPARRRLPGCSEKAAPSRAGRSKARQGRPRHSTLTSMTLESLKPGMRSSLQMTPASSSWLQSLFPQPRCLQSPMLFSPPAQFTLSSQIRPATCQGQR